MTIRYADYITEAEGRLYIPMTPADQKRTGCHTYTYAVTDEGRAKAKAAAKNYAAYVRREKDRLGRDFDIENYL